MGTEQFHPSVKALATNQITVNVGNNTDVYVPVEFNGSLIKVVQTINAAIASTGTPASVKVHKWASATGTRMCAAISVASGSSVATRAAQSATGGGNSVAPGDVIRLKRTDAGAAGRTSTVTMVFERARQ